MTFGNTKVFNAALDGRYGKSTDIKEYIAKAQAQNYEAHRAMRQQFLDRLSMRKFPSILLPEICSVAALG